MSKGSKNNRIKDWQKYWAEYDDIFRKNKIENPPESDPKEKVDNFGDLEYDSFHDLWSRIENGERAWYYDKPE